MKSRPGVLGSSLGVLPTVSGALLFSLVRWEDSWAMSLKIDNWAYVTVRIFGRLRENIRKPSVETGLISKIYRENFTMARKQVALKKQGQLGSSGTCL